MLKFITNIQISRRLLLAFLLAAVIPGIVISLLGFTFVKEQNARSGAVQTNINASKSSDAIDSYFIKMDTALNTLYQRQYENSQTMTPSQTQEGINQLQDQANILDTAIQHFAQDYQMTTAPNMREVYTILVGSDSKTTLPDQQQEALNEVNTFWLAYKDEQTHVQEAIAKKAPIEQARASLLKANDDYMQL